MRKFLRKLRLPPWVIIAAVSAVVLFLLFLTQPWREPWITRIPNIRLQPTRPLLMPKDVKPDSAWEYLRRSSEEETKLHESVRPLWEAFRNEREKLHLIPWSDEEFPTAVQLLDKSQAPMDLARKAAQASDPQVPFFPIYSSVPDAYLSRAEDFPQLFSALAALKISRGDFDGAFADLHTVMDYENATARQSTLLRKVIESGMNMQALRDMRRIALQYPVPEEVVVRTIRRLDQFEKAMEPWEETLRVECNHIPELLDWVLDPASKDFMDDLPDSFKRRPYTMALLAGSPRWRMQSDLESVYTHLIDMASKPYDKTRMKNFKDQFSPQPNDWHFWVMKADPVGYILADMTVFPTFIIDYYLESVDVRATETVLAIRQYEQNEKHPPVGLNDLVPKFLAAVPLDPFDGKPLRYVVKPDGSWIVYSVGPNQLDEGGLVGSYSHSPDNPGDRVYSSKEVEESLERRKQRLEKQNK